MAAGTERRGCVDNDVVLSQPLVAADPDSR